LRACTVKRVVEEMKKFVVFLSVASIHFGLSVLIVPVTNFAANAMNTAQLGPTFVIQTLVAVTRILNFPIISLSWYPRHLFPGDWIRIPILINSFLWACGIFLAVYVFRKVFGKAN
jgi:hypothetical protein